MPSVEGLTHTVIDILSGWKAATVYLLTDADALAL